MTSLNEIPIPLPTLKTSPDKFPSNEHIIIAIIIWFAIMFFLIRKLAKKDNEWHLKDWFKKKKIINLIIKGCY